MATDLPWFKFFPLEYMSDPNVRRMDYECRGIYMELLALVWTEDSIDSDPTELARILNVPRDVMERHHPDLARCFKKRRGTGRWYHAKLAAQKSYNHKTTNRRKEAGRVAANKRWGNKDLDGSPNTSAKVTNGTKNQNQNKSNRNIPPTIEDIPRTVGNGGGVVGFEQDGWTGVVATWEPRTRSDPHLVPEYRAWASENMKTHTRTALDKGWTTYRRRHA